MVYTTGQGAHGFTLDPTIGEFLLSHPRIVTPRVGKYYSVNESNFSRWDKAMQVAVRGLKGEVPDLMKPKNSRYIGSLVADFHRNLIAGGIFLYPADSTNPRGKLRLLYEASPMAFIAEQAEGSATDGTNRILDIMRKGATPLDFEVDLAKKQTDDNPIFYVQMAHARLSGIFRTAEREPDGVTGNLDLAALPAPQDAELLKKLVTFPDVVDKAAREHEPHRITVFLHELATVVHGWYHHTRAVGAPEGPATEHARLLLARAGRLVLANALDLLGVSAPDRM